MTALENFKKRAKELLAGGHVDVVIGYRLGTTAELRRTVFVRSAEAADQLVLDGHCRENLAGYLTRPEVWDGEGVVAIFVQPAGIRTINILAAEGQIDPQRITLLAFELAGSEAIKELPGSSVDDFAGLIENLKSQPAETDLAAEIEKLESLSPQQRFEFWQEQFSKCIRCYACRQACPMCYCRRCIVEQNQPQWICASAHDLGNFEWNIVRAFHLAGRCIECGNCERACPVNIPLMLLNRRLAREALEAFDHFAGIRPDQPPALASFKQDDPQHFIL